MQQHPVVEPTYATMYRTGCADPEFARRCELIEVPASIHTGFHPIQELRVLLPLLRAARRRRALHICSSWGYLRIELLAIILIGLLFGRRGPTLLLYGEMYEPNGGLRGRLERLVMRVIDRWVDGYIVFSNDERASFARTWGVDPAKMHTCGYYHRPKPFPTIERGDYVFSGGNSFRDYAPLIAAAREMPEQQVLIATHSLGDQSAPPPNVRLWWPGIAEWMETLGRAAAVVIPISKGMRRSVGLLLLSEAMWLHKVSIITDSLGIREYVEDGVNGLIVDGSSESYLRAMRWVLDPANADAVAEMSRQAARTAEEKFSLEAHTRRLLALMDALTGAADPPVQAAAPVESRV